MKRGVILTLCMALFGIGTAACNAANSQEWKRLADGRIVLDIKGTAVALPSKGSALRDIKFDLVGSKDLRWAIGSPAEARQFFETSERVSISVPNVYNRDDLFLGRFDRKEFQSLNFSIQIGEGSQGNCRAWERIYDQYQAQFKAAPLPTDDGGWAEFIIDKSPKSWIYVRVRDSFNDWKYLDSFSCDAFGFCSTTTCIGADKAFIYQFHRDIQKREDWAATVKRARDVAKLILIDMNK
jgi:hypothetical protein